MTTGKYVSGPSWCGTRSCRRCFPRTFAEKCHDLYGLDELILLRDNFSKRVRDKYRARAKRWNTGAVIVPLDDGSQILLAERGVETEGISLIPAIAVARTIATALHVGLDVNKRISFIGWQPYKRPKQYITDAGRAKTRRIHNRLVREMCMEQIDPATIDDTMAAIRKEVERRGRRINSLNSKEPIRDLLAPEQ